MVRSLLKSVLGLAVSACGVVVAFAFASFEAPMPASPYAEYGGGVPVVEASLSMLLSEVSMDTPVTEATSETKADPKLTASPEGAGATEVLIFDLDIPPLPEFAVDLSIDNVAPSVDATPQQMATMMAPAIRPDRLVIPTSPTVSERTQTVQPQPHENATPQTAVQPQAEAQARAEQARAAETERARQAAALRQALANYPAQVQNKIRRTRQRGRAPAGLVYIHMQIAGNGALAGLGVAQSSGNATTDRVAMQHIQRAAPFPAPPDRQTKTFTVPVTIR